MIFKYKIKVYVPMMKVDCFGNMTSVFDISNELQMDYIINKYDSFIEFFCKICGGMTVYDCNGKYYNRKRDRIYSYPMQVIEFYYNDAYFKDIKQELLSFLLFILNDFEQYEVSVEKNNIMHCLNKDDVVHGAKTLWMYK